MHSNSCHVLTAIFFVYFLFGGRLVSQKLVSFHPNGWGNIECYDRMEIGIIVDSIDADSVESFLSGQAGINPYDYNRVHLKATFQNSKYVFERDGFYYREIAIDSTNGRFVQSKSACPFRFRFAPPTPGVYKVNVEIKLNNSVEMQSATFSVIPGNHRGPLTMGNSFHLKYSDNKNFVVVGQNIPFADYPTAGQSHSSFRRQRRFISDLASAGGNFVRLRLDPWSNELEQEELGVYGSSRMQGENFERQWHAWELDQTFEILEKNNVYLYMTLQSDAQLKHKASFPFDWNTNPYKKIASEPEQFFDLDGKCFEIYKNKLRYILARYGYSPNLTLMGLLNETDNVEGYNSDVSVRLKVSRWLRAVAAFLKAPDSYPTHLLTSGYATGPEQPDLGLDNSTLFDVLTINHYSTSRQVIKQRHDGLEHLWASLDSRKPFIFGELGVGLCDYPHQDWFSDADFHNTAWSTAMFHKSLGTGLYWWDWEQESHLVPENSAVLGINHRANFKAISNFFRISPPPFDMDRFTSDWDSDLEFINRLENRKIEWISNVNSTGTKGFGWVHNSDYYWINDPLGLRRSNCPNCAEGGLEAFYDSECYQESTSELPYFNEPKGPYDYGKKHEDIVLKGFIPLRSYKLEIWSCYGDGGVVSTQQERSDAIGRIKFRRNLGRYPGDSDYGDPDFAYKIYLNKINFETTVFAYPNPTSGIINVTSELPIEQAVIFNPMGVGVLEQSGHLNLQISIDLGSLPSGFYVLNLLLKDGTVSTLKVIRI